MQQAVENGRRQGLVAEQRCPLGDALVRRRSSLTATADSAKADGEESPFQYCSGDPVNRTDPNGLWWDEVKNGLKKAGKAAWGGVKTAGRGIRRAAVATDRFIRSSRFQSFMRQNAIGYTAVDDICHRRLTTGTALSLVEVAGTVATGGTARAVTMGARGGGRLLGHTWGRVSASSTRHINEGIYVIKYKGKSYVGQSGNMADRLPRHVKRFGEVAVRSACQWPFESLHWWPSESLHPHSSFFFGVVRLDLASFMR